MKLFNKLFISLVLLFSVLSNPGLVAKNQWERIEQKIQNSVVQVFSQMVPFNWLEPFKPLDSISGSGTAFFIDNKHLLTNYHVIDQAKQVYINVPFLGRKPLNVEILGVCPEIDVALMKLTDESFNIIEKQLGQISFLDLGDSDYLHRAETVMAIGFPMGGKIKTTVGVVAGEEFFYGNSYLHVTSPINPGNSGGPSINVKGDVIGINTAGVLGAQNIGYIVPINNIKLILDNLYKSGLYKKPHLGISFNHATDEHAKLLNNPVPGGIYITDVEKHSVSDKAGVKPKDMLYALNYNDATYEVDEYGDVLVNWRNTDKISLAELLSRIKQGEDLTLVIYRAGKKMEIKCKFDQGPKYSIRTIYPDFELAEIDYEILGGAIIMQLRKNHISLLSNTILLHQYILPEHENDEVLVVTSVLPGSYAYKVGCFQAGSLLEEVNGVKVKNLSDLRKALLKSTSSNLIEVSTKDYYSTVLSLKKIIQEEPKLSRDFNYPITDMMKNLVKLSKDS